MSENCEKMYNIISQSCFIQPTVQKPKDIHFRERRLLRGWNQYIINIFFLKKSLINIVSAPVLIMPVTMEK